MLVELQPYKFSLQRERGSNFPRIVTSAFCPALKTGGEEASEHGRQSGRQRRAGRRGEAQALHLGRGPPASSGRAGERKHWRKGPVGISGNKKETRRKRWQTGCLRGEEGNRTVTNDGKGEW